MLSKNSERVLLVGTTCKSLLDCLSLSDAIESCWC